LPDSAKKRALVIGSGPNGLTAAIVLARAGLAVTIHEGSATIGGGARTEELTLPGFLHDVCSSVYPLAVSSPCFEQFPLAAHGLEWIHPDAPLAHPLDDGSAVILERSIDETARNLGPDADAWRRLFEPLADAWNTLRGDILEFPKIPRHTLGMARFGWNAISSARGLATNLFRGPRARVLFAGLAGHSVMPLEQRLSASIGMVLGVVAHALGWPIARGGAQSISNSLAGYLHTLGAEIRTLSRVTSLPSTDIVMCDITPRQLLAIAGDRLPDGYRRALARFRYGPGVYKIDWALDGPIPWRARECARAATVHLGGTLEEIAAWESHFVGSPFLILVQPSLFDSTRAPAGKHTAWAYCHVPNGSAYDLTEATEQQVERFAPGFKKRILARHVLTPAGLEARNPNLVGGDIGGGAMTPRQIFLRPTYHLYRTPLEAVWLCSSSTPPGGGVHGMCGYNAAQRALRG
jgi:phytoene dehydrogenase-like protein